ncbi:DUF4266 domain-containing protein [Saccharospirillum salsuginis]|uniref:DUF4266 domain-containing protein n=1 Tax=Saccharospirillum salsuginis TaxID=418750 RepID=A0A918K5U2_9GAMM|nr:DUF4266 domain-containing protein [Saccharospirillum salsuginis]GGX51059.1 hypothetical protein GCM10007392_17870 [Saccharospirillum salsuginis]
MSIKSLTITLVALLLATGCTTVKPWQRGTLAKPEMSWSPDPLEATLENHIYYSKEASFGGTAAAGGGCGCN